MNIRLSSDLHEQTKIAAQHAKRNLSDYIRVTLEEANDKIIASARRRNKQSAQSDAVDA